MTCYLDEDEIDEIGGLTIAEESNRFLSKAHVYEYPKADNTTDAVVFGVDFNTGALQVLLIERGKETEPFYGSWALPGGFLDLEEDLDACVARELEEECQVQVSHLEQLYTFGKPGRDPRGRVISTAYYALVRPDQIQPKADDDAAKVQWFDVRSLPDLAFDHEEIIETAVKRLRAKLSWAPVGFNLLPEVFTIQDLQSLYEIILGREIPLNTLRGKMKRFGVLEEAGRGPSDGGRRPHLYRFNQQVYERLQNEGIEFEV